MTTTREFSTAVPIRDGGPRTPSVESPVGGGRYVTSGSRIATSGSFTGVSGGSVASGSYVSSFAERAFGSYISA